MSKGKVKPLKIKIYNLEEFDKDILEEFLRVVEGKVKLIPVRELKVEKE